MYKNYKKFNKTADPRINSNYKYRMKMLKDIRTEQVVDEVIATIEIVPSKSCNTIVASCEGYRDSLFADYRFSIALDVGDIVLIK